MLLYRTDTDKNRIDVSPVLCDSYPGGSCWIIGAGPSLLNLSDQDIERIQNSPAAKFAVNHGGRRKDGSWIIKPTHWTSYDPTDKFSQALYNDPSIVKFVSGTRSMDVVPDDTRKLCDAPNMYFITKEDRPYSRMFDRNAQAVLDCRDSFIQAIDIAFRLGFRRLYCIGTELKINPSPEQRAYIESFGLTFEDDLLKRRDGYLTDRLSEMVEEVRIKAGMPSKGQATAKLFEDKGREDQYCFGDRKAFAAAVSCDGHYWERVQFLRLGRRCMELNGLELYSCTPKSRLNSVFKYLPVWQAVAEIQGRTGSYQEDLERAYTDRMIPYLALHRDVPAFSWPKEAKVVEVRKDRIPVDEETKVKIQELLANKEVKLDD